MTFFITFLPIKLRCCYILLFTMFFILDTDNLDIRALFHFACTDLHDHCDRTKKEKKLLKSNPLLNYCLYSWRSSLFGINDKIIYLKAYLDKLFYSIQWAIITIKYWSKNKLRLLNYYQEFILIFWDTLFYIIFNRYIGFLEYT